MLQKPSEIGFYTDGETEVRRCNLLKATKLVSGYTLIGTKGRGASATHLCLCRSGCKPTEAPPTASGLSFSLVLRADVDGGKNQHGEESDSRTIRAPPTPKNPSAPVETGAEYRPGRQGLTIPSSYPRSSGED